MGTSPFRLRFMAYSPMLLRQDRGNISPPVRGNVMANLTLKSNPQFRDSEDQHKWFTI